MVEAINPYLTKVFVNNRVRITCDAWRRLFQLQDPVYHGMCLELYVTITFQGGEDYYDTNVLTFCLGSEYRECSMAEFAWRMGLYQKEELMTGASGCSWKFVKKISQTEKLE